MLLFMKQVISMQNIIQLMIYLLKIYWNQILNEFLRFYDVLVGKERYFENNRENPQEIKEAEYKFRDILFNKARSNY